MSEVAHTPQLRFPEFSGEWEDGKLGNYGNLINGLTYSPDNIVDEGLLVLRSSNVQNGQIYLNDNVYVNLDVDDAALTREDDILICVRNGSKRLIGKSTIINKNLPKSTHGAFMTVFRGESNKFISHWFHSSIYYKEVHKNLGATINSINGSDLKKFKTIFPLKPEQQKIAAFLTTVDSKIEQLSKKKALLGEYKKGLMQKIFSQAIRFKADDGSTFPEWKEKKLGDIVRFENGKGHEQNISKDGKFIVVNSKFVSSQGRVKKYTDTQKSPLNFGDVVMVMSDVPNGKALAKCYYIEQDNLYSLNQRICGLKHKLADTKFIYYRINRHKYFLSFDSGVGQTNLKKMEVLNCPLNIPTDIKEQTKIANFLSSIDNKIEQVGKQLDGSKQFKKALLQQMFV